MSDEHEDGFENSSLLNDKEARILGALMEKQLTTPDVYPLTLNSLVLACNQKTSREPVTAYESGEVQRNLSQLQDRQLIAIDYSARAQRYDQRLSRVLSLDQQGQAIMNVLLLRGAQTPGEILARTQRMFAFSAESLLEKLEQLCARTKPVIVRLPRQPGRREDRYMHLLCGTPDLTTVAPSRGSDNTEFLEQRIRELEAQVAELQQQVAQLSGAPVPEN